MMPCGPLADDWLFWDPETIFAYPAFLRVRSGFGASPRARWRARAAGSLLLPKLISLPPGE